LDLHLHLPSAPPQQSPQIAGANSPLLVALDQTQRYVLRLFVTASRTLETCAVRNAHNCRRPCRPLLFARAQAGTRSSNITNASTNSLRPTSPISRLPAKN
jgi:hypothetical protein